MREAAFAEARARYGDRVVDRALRLRRSVGLEPRGDVRPYLCHAMCELGSILWLDSLRQVRDWMDAYPREVVTLFVQDEVSPRETAAVVEEAGLLPMVHQPAADGAWPTLGEMVGSGRRLVVLMENRSGGDTWPWLIDDWRHVPRNSAEVNARDVLEPRLRECAEERGQLPDFVAVDYYDRGDLFAVIDDLNGVA